MNADRLRAGREPSRVKRLESMCQETRICTNSVSGPALSRGTPYLLLPSCAIGRVAMAQYKEMLPGNSWQPIERRISSNFSELETNRTFDTARPAPLSL